jgi:catechol 2,3-dioxygenase-like lactoylglutathione lyase family enzyme
MRIKLNSLFVDDQDKALRFYTEVLGFVKSKDIPVGGGFRWLTLVSPEGGDTELVLEPNAHPAARAYQEALLADGIPATAFEVDDVKAEHARLSGRGVVFHREPTPMGEVTIAVFADTCGNWIQICAKA